jgi:hypothetical protein
MLGFAFLAAGDVPWANWLPLGAGAAAMSLVLGLTVAVQRWRRRRRAEASREEDLPWQDLLGELEQLLRERAAAGLPPGEATDDDLARLLARLPAVPDARPLEMPEDREFQLVGGDERRAGRRRWGNPTEVSLHSPLWFGRRHGLVVNRSTGGLGIYADGEAPPGTPLQVRAAEAPAAVPAVRAEVRHCLPAGKGFLLGCKFSEDLPWNVRVWFG